MFTPVYPHMVVALAFGMIAPLSAKIPASNSRPFSEGSVSSGRHAVPAVENSKGAPALRRKPSPHLKLAVSNGLRPYEIEADSLQKGLARMSAIYRKSARPAKGAS